MNAELAARRTAAAAVRGDFEREWHGYSMQGGAEPAWQVWAQRLSEAVASLLDAPGPDPADSPAGEDLADGTEPYCLTCREWIGMFHGMEGWHHFRGDGSPGGIRTLFEAGHEPVAGWMVPPGRGLSPAGMDTLRQALDAARQLQAAAAENTRSGYAARCSALEALLRTIAAAVPGTAGRDGAR